MSKLQKDIPTGCCCECREKTPMEIIRERITDEHELEIVLKALARLRCENADLRQQCKKKIRDNETLVYGLIQALNYEKQAEDYSKMKENYEMMRLILNDLERGEGGVF